MIVMKFGGTSVEDAPSIARVTGIIRARLPLQPVVVVSATGKTTRRLLGAARSSAAGDSSTTLKIVNELKDSHLALARGVLTDSTGRSAFAIIDAHFNELTKLLEGLAILGEVPPRGLDKILAYGELLSSAILTDALLENGTPARLLDARQLIKTDDRWGNASPLFDLTTSRMRDQIPPVLQAGEVPVLQGFIGSTRENATTTLGFEGSDYTAAIVGAALDAEDIQIWKDVSGLMTCDPKVFPGARTVKRCSFAEAAELTYFGAKVLHPKAIHPAARKNIPVHIYNSKDPEATGTVIEATAPPCKNRIKSIAYLRPVTVINIGMDPVPRDLNSASVDGFLRSVLLSLGRRAIAPLITAVSASNVTLAINAAHLADGIEREVLDDFSRIGNPRADNGKAIVSLVGEELKSDSALMTKVFGAIGETRLGGVFYGSSSLTVNFIIEMDEVERVIARIHDVFFTTADPAVFE